MAPSTTKSSTLYDDDDSFGLSLSSSFNTTMRPESQQLGSTDNDEISEERRPSSGTSGDESDISSINERNQNVRFELSANKLVSYKIN